MGHPFSWLVEKPKALRLAMLAQNDIVMGRGMEGWRRFGSGFDTIEIHTLIEESGETCLDGI